MNQNSGTFREKIDAAIFFIFNGACDATWRKFWRRHFDFVKVFHCRAEVLCTFHQVASCSPVYFLYGAAVLTSETYRNIGSCSFPRAQNRLFVGSNHRNILRFCILGFHKNFRAQRRLPQFDSKTIRFLVTAQLTIAESNKKVTGKKKHDRGTFPNL